MERYTSTRHVYLFGVHQNAGVSRAFSSHQLAQPHVQDLLRRGTLVLAPEPAPAPVVKPTTKPSKKSKAKPVTIELEAVEVTEAL